MEQVEEVEQVGPGKRRACRLAGWVEQVGPQVGWKEEEEEGHLFISFGFGSCCFFSTSAPSTALDTEILHLLYLH